MFDTAFSSGAVMVCTFLTGIAVARLLGPVGRGQFGELVFLGSLFVNFLSLSLFEALVVRLRKRGNAARPALPLALVLALAVFALAACIAPLGVAVGWIRVGNIEGTAITGIVLTICLIEFLNYAFRSVESSTLKFGRINLERVLTPFTFVLLMGGAMALGTRDTVLVVALFIIAKLPITIIRLVHFRHDLIGPIDRRLGRETIGLGPRLFAGNGTLLFASQVDRIIIMTVWSAAWIGFYFIALSACTVGYTLAQQAVSITLLPTLAGLSADEARDKIHLLLRLSIMLAVAITAGVIITAPFLVPFFYGERFAPAIGFVQGLAVATSFTPALTIVNLANRANERGGPGLAMAICSIAIYALGYVLSGYRQPYDLFAAVTLANGVSFLIGFVSLMRDGLADPRGIVPRPSDITLFAAAALRYLHQSLRKPFAMFGRH